MNITTHGKGGTKVTLLAAERRLVSKTLDLLDTLRFVPSELQSFAHSAHMAARWWRSPRIRANSACSPYQGEAK